MQLQNKEGAIPKADLIVDLHGCSHPIAELLCPYTLEYFVKTSDLQTLMLISGLGSHSKEGNAEKMTIK